MSASGRVSDTRYADLNVRKRGGADDHRHQATDRTRPDPNRSYDFPDG
jgi:hypothetical protein